MKRHLQCLLLQFAVPFTGTIVRASRDDPFFPLMAWGTSLSDALLQLTWDDAYHFGGIPGGYRAPNESSLVTAAESAPFMVGDFTHADDSRHAFAVNKDLAKSHACEITFRNTPNIVQAVSPYTGQLVNSTGEEKWLAAGQGVLLELDWREA